MSRNALNHTRINCIKNAMVDDRSLLRNHGQTWLIGRDQQRADQLARIDILLTKESVYDSTKEFLRSLKAQLARDSRDLSPRQQEILKRIEKVSNMIERGVIPIPQAKKRPRPPKFEKK